MAQIRAYGAQDEIAHFHAEEIIEHLKKTDVKANHVIAGILLPPKKFCCPTAETLPPVKPRQWIALNLLAHVLDLAKLCRLLDFPPFVLRPRHDVFHAAHDDGGMEGAHEAV